MDLYLTAVEIKNFQSHEYTKIELCPNTNGLVGTSNSGKSSFLRALRWNLTNTPSGGDFIRKGETETSVTTYFSDGHAIERTRNRTGSKNYYILYKDGEVLEEFTGFGTKVPDMILEITKADPNFLFYFANQMEGPFLLSDTPKVRAETIGNFEDLGKIDLEVTSVNEDIRLTKKEQKQLQKELTDLTRSISEQELALQEEKEKVEFLKILKDSILEKRQIIEQLEVSKGKVKRYEEEIDVIEKELETSKRIVNAWNEELPQKVNEFKQLMNAKNRLSTIEQELSSIKIMDKAKIERLEELTEFITNMRLTYHTLENLYKRMKRNEQDIAEVKSSMKPKVANMDLSHIDLKIESYTMLFKYGKRLREIEGMQQETQDEISRSKERVGELLNEFVDVLTNEKICPTCYQQTENVSKELIETHI